MTIPESLAKRIDLLITDANGVPRGKTLESEAIDEAYLPRMAEAVLFQCIHGNYAEETMDAFNPKDEDLVLSPDWSTYRPIPWKEEDIGQV
ncbi:MAG: hypothetical protein ACPH09_11560, partial [Pseudomonadales bacterium]